MRRIVARRVRRTARDESGFTVIEVLVAIAVVTIVMTSLARFFVTSGNLTDYQSQRQTAAQAAETAMDKARSLSGVGAVHDRDKSSSDALWSDGLNATSTAKYPGVSAYLTNVAEAYDSTASDGAGATAPLPTGGRTVTLGGMTYTQNWFLGYCLRQSDGTCKKGSDPSADNTYLQVVVDVTWTNKSCANSACSYVTAGQISESPDPVFGRPAIAPIDDQSNEAGSTVSLAAIASGGTGPYVWSATGLPPGITISGTGTTSTMSGRPTATGIYTVVVKIADSLGGTDSEAFIWTITPGPTIAAIPDQSNEVGATVSLTATASGGTAPYVWSATGLPPGITISGSATTATMSGTPTTAGRYSVVVKVVDAAGSSDTEPFTWTITPGPTIAPIADQSGYTGTAVSLNATVSGGTGPYRWSAASLPPGLSISGTGTTAKISGTPTWAGTFNVTVTVVDAAGVKDTETLTWTLKIGLSANDGSCSGPYSSHSGMYYCTWSLTGAATGPYTWTSDKSYVNISVSGLTATYSMWVTRGTYTIMCTVAQSNGVSRQAVDTAQAGTA